MNTEASKTHAVRRGRTGAALCAGLLVLTAGSASAARISGEVVDVQGAPLARVPVCLKASPDDESCSKLRYTDRSGAYRFTGVKAGAEYSVEIYYDKAVAARRLETYRTYVWSPAARPVALSNRSDDVALAPFVGTFNFSNFQRVLRLVASDFPELVEFDLALDYVVLKVFFQPDDPERAPETIFLGQVTDPDRIELEASVPLSTAAIGYEIYSASLSRTGLIALSDG